eukprot:1866745-Pleurochrysis_carterae.AAC.2
MVRAHACACEFSLSELSPKLAPCRQSFRMGAETHVRRARSRRGVHADAMQCSFHKAHAPLGSRVHDAFCAHVLTADDMPSS